MKRLLLSVLFLFISLASNAQATAYDVPDLNQCGYEIFDLTTQNAVALGNQDPENFTITYFTSEASAASSSPAITNPTAYVPNTWQQTIFLRVTNTDTGEYDITSFQVIVTSGNAVGNFSDITVCDVYTIPALAVGSYYTGPGGTGTLIAAGTSVTATTTLYVYYTNGTCTSEDSFTVTVVPTPIAPEIADVTTCGAYTLPVPPAGFSYTTSVNGSGTVIPAGTIITTSQTIYVYSTNTNCIAETSFTVTINGNGASLVPPNPVIACDTNFSGFGVFNLLAAQAEFEANNPDTNVVAFYTTQADAQAGVNPIVNAGAYLNMMPGQQTIYLAATSGECTVALPLELVVLACGTTSTLSGTVTLDANGNGCDTTDGPAAGIQVSHNVGNLIFTTYTDVYGNYTFADVPEGIVNLWIQPINGQQFTANPSTVSLNLPNDNTVNNFCAGVPQPFTDVAAYLSPYSQAVPGFTAYYAVTVVNYGTQAASGSVSFSYDAALLSNPLVTGATQSGNIITWAYTNLVPYQSQTFYVYLTVNTPPTVTGGTALLFSVAASTTATDVNGDNNAYVYSQYAVNSFDPNDITIREGEYITEQQADGFLHYTIRFQNTGTANAQNVKISLPLHENLDWNTFQPVSASHPYHANRQGGITDFMFDNIQLPFESANATASHGYVTFRIKPVADIALGESMSETAYIYFDFNEAIVTNTATTTVGALAINDFTKANAALYPNPASGVVNLMVKGGLSANANVAITDMLGKTVVSAPLTAENTAVNISGLTSGVYFVTVQNDTTQSTQKLIIK